MTSGLGNAAMLAAIAIVPLIVLVLTSFVKLSVVLSLVRNAIGAPDAPSGLVVTGLALVLTFFVMAPVAIEMAHAAQSSDQVAAPAPGSLDGALRELVPTEYQGQLAAAERAVEPLRGFLAKHAGQKDRETFTDLAHAMGRQAEGHELWVLGPAFVTTELREAFAIAVVIFVPFLVIDLIVGLALAALGLQAMSPQVVALPLKLLLFVAVDGWRMLIDALLRGYA
jgi:type III secretion protein R